MHKILVIRLYFPLDALHVSDYISPSSGATFISCTSHLVHADTIRVAVVWLYAYTLKEVTNTFIKFIAHMREMLHDVDRSIGAVNKFVIK